MISALGCVLTGCVGYVGPGPSGYVYGPDVYVFGGYGHGNYDRDNSRRGAESRSFHGGGARSGGRHR